MFRHIIAWLAILAAPLAAEVKVFKGFTLIDGSGGAPAPGSAIIVDNGRISWIGPTAKLKAPAGAENPDPPPESPQRRVEIDHVEQGVTAPAHHGRWGVRNTSTVAAAARRAMAAAA